MTVAKAVADDVPNDFTKSMAKLVGEYDERLERDEVDDEDNYRENATQADALAVHLANAQGCREQ